MSAAFRQLVDEGYCDAGGTAQLGEVRLAYIGALRSECPYLRESRLEAAPAPFLHPEEQRPSPFHR